MNRRKFLAGLTLFGSAAIVTQASDEGITEVVVSREQMEEGFGLAPIKAEGTSVEYDGTFLPFVS